MLKRSKPWAVVCLFALAGLVSLAAGTAGAQEDQQADMAAYMAAATPGEYHALLAKSAGDWTVTSTMWMAPGMPPQESTGTATKTMLLDRYLQEKYSSNFMGMPFTGISILGYDNVTEQFQGVWFDNMSTMLMPFTGTFDAERNAIVCTSEYVDAASHETKSVRMVTILDSDDEHHFEYYTTGPDGQEFKSMEMVYTRVE